jgi:hypothetical protein
MTNKGKQMVAKHENSVYSSHSISYGTFFSIRPNHSPDMRGLSGSTGHPLLLWASAFEPSAFINLIPVRPLSYRTNNRLLLFRNRKSSPIYKLAGKLPVVPCRLIASSKQNIGGL